MAGRSNVIEVSDDDDIKPVSLRQGTFSATKKRKQQPPDHVEIVEWTDDSEDAAYDALKKRRKSASGKSAKGKGKAKGPTPDTKRKRKSKGWKDDGSVKSDGEDQTESLLPEYLRERRHEFDQSRELLKEAGLRLPPDYSDISFSDDEQIENLEKKPQFHRRSGVKPCHPYKDILLEHSLGLIPASIAQYLRDYQIDGVKFLHYLFVYQKGGILGDDMGLGKTVQVAAFLTAAFGKTGDRRDAKRMRRFRRTTDRWYPRALIICPGSLTQNWKTELNRWGWWEADLFHGAGKDDVLLAARAGRLEIMITTYTTYKNCCDQINRVAWDVVVADECHQIKDISAGVTQAMNGINSLCRIGLTGTAIQNKYEELWTLLNWTNPGQFGTMAEWKNTICRPLTVGQSHDATLQQLRLARTTANKLVHNLLPRFFIRRMKSLIADQLPKKTDRVVFSPLSELQREAYETFLESPLVTFVRTAYDVCSCGSELKRGWCCFQVNDEGESWRALVFPIIIALQKLSNHLTLLVPQATETTEKQNRELRFLKAALPDRWNELYSSRNSLLSLSNPDYCGKWNVLKKLLRFWHGNGDKVLVFSHSVRLLGILQHLFRNTSYNVSYLDGSLSYEERQRVVDDFNTDASQFVFLISTKAGGVGLNITSANKVVIMDPHWNPAYDLQAQDRAYRIGQTRDVAVFRLISAGTIEEITYARQIYKQQQANIGYNASTERRYFKGVQQDKERKGEIFGIDNLLTYHGDQVVLRDIVNKTNIAEAKAGVNLIDIEVDEAIKDADNHGAIKKEEEADPDDGGLSQLASFLTRDEKSGPSTAKSKQKPKSDEIAAILASANITYTHENSEVVGSSKVEEHLSKKAEMAMSQDSGVLDHVLFRDSQEEAANAATGSSHYQYNPPQEVMQRQFCTMAATFGFSSAVEFALAVESMTQDQRQNCLDLFYKRRTEKLKLDGDETEGTEGSTSQIKVEVKAEIKSEVKAEPKVEPGITTGQHELETAGSNVACPPSGFGKRDEPDIKVKDEDKVEIKTEVTGYTAQFQEGSKSSNAAKRLSTTIWLSDDDETDEL